MDAIIGRYRVRMAEAGMVLTHPTGISFDLTVDDALSLYEFIDVYRQVLKVDERETDPEIKRVVLKEPPQER